MVLEVGAELLFGVGVLFDLVGAFIGGEADDGGDFCVVVVHSGDELALIIVQRGRMRKLT